MSDPVRRARAHYPTIQITMVSIIVALVLQQWLNLLPTIDELWQPTLLAARIWCQALTAFAIIVKMWSGFVLAAVVNERVPRAIELLGPIGILVFVDAQIASIGVDHVLRWWYVMGAGSLVAAAFLVSQTGTITDEDNAIRSEFIEGRSNIGRRIGIRHPATVELWFGITAIGIAVLHQVAHLSEIGLLVAGAIYLAGEMLSAVGPIAGWQLLRRIEEGDKSTIAGTRR